MLVSVAATSHTSGQLVLTWLASVTSDALETNKPVRDRRQTHY
jgi:hypothetical protein